MENDKPKPNFYWSLLNLRCPRCRRGHMFIHKNPYKKFGANYILKMHKRCHICQQRFELEPGFWLGTSYMSYAMNIAFSTITFLLWWLIIGFSLDDDRLLYWIIFNGTVILILQPFFMRLSRLLYLSLFVKYNENYENEEAVSFS